MGASPASPGLAVGVDIGGTKIAAGLVGADGSVVTRVRRDTPADARAIALLIADVARELEATQNTPPLPVGVGAAGLIDRDGTVVYAPNIAWKDYPLRAEVAGLLGVPVTVDNDANAAAWAEHEVGAGAVLRGDARPSVMVTLTIGTGVGSGLVVDGALLRGAHGVGAEFGHMIVAEGGPVCGCGNRGCLEALAAGNAIGRVAAEALEAGEVPADSRLHGAQAVTGKAVTVAAHAGDPFARDVLTRCGFWLGVGLASITNGLDPDLIVVGGGALEAGELLLQPARDAMGARLLGRGHRAAPPVVRAQLADDAGLVGAGLLALAARP